MRYLPSASGFDVHRQRAHLLGPHTPRRDLEVAVAGVSQVIRAGLQHGLDVFLRLEQHVNVAFGRIATAVLARPLDPNRPERPEGECQGRFSDVPRHSAQEHLADERREEWVSQVGSTVGQ